MKEITMEMSDEEKLRWEKWERQIEMIKFYAMAKKHGFCFPGCECKDCMYAQGQQV
jgi:hypothetical protein